MSKRIFRNKKTGHRVECDIVKDEHLIITLEKDKEYKELIFV